MNHQPYQDWLFVDSGRPEEALSVEQAAALRAHLDECAACRQLSVAWRSVEEDLEAAPLLSPAPGFAGRWQNRQAADRLFQRSRQHRQQSLLILGISLGVAFVLFTALIYLAWPFVQSPRLLVWTSLYQLVHWVSLFDATQQFLGSLLRAADIAIPPLSWIFAAGGLTLLCVLWVVSYRVLTHPRSVYIRNG
jgi:predicted anti-sigma-YlaC factor YlaD